MICSDKEGFTLMDLIIVIAILDILTAVLVPGFSGYVKRSRIPAVQAVVRNLNGITQLSKDEFILSKTPLQMKVKQTRI